MTTNADDDSVKQFPGSAGPALQESNSRTLTLTPAAQYKHQRQRVNFRLKAQPLSNGMIPWIFRPAHEHLDIGGLFEHLMQVLNNSAGLTVNKVNFTLANVLSPFTLSSVGFNRNPPPSQAMPNVTALIVFTFALRQNTAWVRPMVARQFRSTYVNTWTTEKSALPQFVNIALDLSTAKKFGLTALTWYRLQYLYYVIGMMTKNAVLRGHRRQVGAKYTTGPDVWSDYGKIQHQTITALALRVPIQYWAYSEQLLELAPNLLSDRHITPEFVQFCILTDRLNCTKFSEPRRREVRDLLSDALMLFVQQVNDLGDAQLDTSETLIALALLVRRSDYPVHSERDLHKYARSVFSALNKYSDQVSQLLVPFDRVADQMLSIGGSRALARVSSLLDLSLQEGTE